MSSSIRATTLALLAAMLVPAAVVHAQAPPRFSPMLIESNAFPEGGIIPPKFAIRGGSTQPDFRISHVPEGTKSFAVIFHDISAAVENGPGDVLHWIAWNIPGETRDIAEGSLPEGSVTGRNISGRNVYIGPGAPPGPRHHFYVFEFYALDATLDLPEEASRPELLEAMKGKVIGKSAYVGRYRSDPAPAEGAASGR